MKMRVEIVQSSPTDIIDVRVVNPSSPSVGTRGVRKYTFEFDVTFAEIMQRIGMNGGDAVDVKLRAAVGSPLRREALRSAEVGYVDIGRNEMSEERQKLERCFAKDVFGQ